MGKVGELRVDSWTQDNAEKGTRQEMIMLVAVREWAEKEAPPCDVTVSADWGFRLFFKPNRDATDEDKHRLLAWLVRSTGTKFVRFFREDSGQVAWWNSGDECKMKDGDVVFRPLIFLENAPIGKCRVVETEKLVKVKELVCEEIGS